VGSRIQLSLNSFGSICFSFIPKARDGLSLYGLEISAPCIVGRAFSSLVGFVPFVVTGFLEVNGILNGGIVIAKATIVELLGKSMRYRTGYKD